MSREKPVSVDTVRVERGEMESVEIPREPVSSEARCICGNPLQKPKRGPMPSYCSAACRVRAHRGRR